MGNRSRPSWYDANRHARPVTVGDDGLVGWRWWLAAADPGGRTLTGVLTSPLWISCRWDRGPVVARCLPWWSRHDQPADTDRDPVPHTGDDGAGTCGRLCGIHATTGPRIALSWLAGVGVNPGGIPLAGTVRLWGRVVEHELGWRASRATVGALMCPPDPVPTRGTPHPGTSVRLAALVRDLAARLGVPTIEPPGPWGWVAWGGSVRIAHRMFNPPSGGPWAI